MRILVGLLALPGYRPGLPVLVGLGAGAVVFVVAGRLGSHRAVARHGSECPGPGEGHTRRQDVEIIARCKVNLPLLLPHKFCSIKGTIV